MKYKDLDIIGSEEWCVFEDLEIPAIKARVDSGAKTSSIQANNIKVYTKGAHEWVKFEVNPLQDNRGINIDCKARLVDRRTVKSSSGISEERFVIKTPVRVGNHTFDIELTLANRDTMEYRMLLGREALNERFVVNPAVSFNLGEFTATEISQRYASHFKEKTGLKIALLASNPLLYSNKRIMEAGEAMGHDMVFLNVEHAYMKLDANSPEIRYRGGNILNEFDAIIPRIKPAVTFYGCALIRQFDNLGVYCLNSAEAITQSRDKLFASQLFSKNDIHIPITGFAKSPMDTKDLIRMVNGAPLIIKLLESTQGKGVVLAETNKAAESVINAFKSVQTNILVQEFIKEANGQDIRCFVVNGKVVASIQRQAEKGEFRANLHQGGKASIIRITAEERKLAVKAAKVLNLAVAGVDIIRSNKGPLLLEVNSSPGLEGIENATGKDIASIMIRAIESKIKFSV
ncbi:SSU ribosomal protein S6P modification protein [Arenibacter palladensis]|uniref:Probable alpha-L-glutamate ligase n=1 Tax=Arenibacter palladensis TaxID=237373 RepID=A0A1M4T476_9FLAO|nr:30S ribosomal protein S6--L-glutamate ligase [Arenibacter palladensis]MDO6603997.1 30S ribosomal protein S6--L-glutamate ligase [Arenibacter palladensis]SHE39286.1 SSU ribosomal protein S6P modification protein [Arenibacter palladensis]|tara:strand:- start:5251 stop:6627 length:1377 start_codon:yes stop_codon:yes gene_type:complete